MLPAGISHSGQVPLHNTSPSWAPPPHLTLNKHSLHYPQFAQDRKGKIYTDFAWDHPPLPVSVFRALTSTAGQAQAETSAGEVRVLQAARGVQPLPQPAPGEAHAGRRQKSLPASQLHRSPLAKERRLAGSSRWWAKGKSRLQGLLRPVLSSSFVVESSQLTRGGRLQEKASPHFNPKTQGMQSPPPSVPTAEPAQPLSARAKGERSRP